MPVKNYNYNYDVQNISGTILGDIRFEWKLV